MLRKNLYISKIFIALCICWILGLSVLLLKYSNRDILVGLNSLHTPTLDMFFSTASIFAQWEFAIMLIALWHFIPEAWNKNFYLTILVFAAVTITLTTLLKRYINWDRPLNEIAGLYTVPWLPQNYHHGMPSGHTTAAFALSTVLHACYRLPKITSSIVLFCCAMLCGISRVYLAQHYPIDVLAGTLLGLTLGYVLSLFIIKKLRH